MSDRDIYVLYLSTRRKLYSTLRAVWKQEQDVGNIQLPLQKTVGCNSSSVNHTDNLGGSQCDLIQVIHMKVKFTQWITQPCKLCLPFYLFCSSFTLKTMLTTLCKQDIFRQISWYIWPLNHYFIGFCNKDLVDFDHAGQLWAFQGDNHGSRLNRKEANIRTDNNRT